MPEQKELLCCFLKFTCCVFHIFGYIQNLLRHFSLSFLLSVLPLLLSSFDAVYVGIWNLIVSKKKSANTEHYSIKQPCCCCCMNDWALTLWLHSHHVTFFSNDIGCFTPVCLWLVYPEAKRFLLIRPRRRQTGSYHSSPPLEKDHGSLLFKPNQALASKRQDRSRNIFCWKLSSFSVFAPFFVIFRHFLIDFLDLSRTGRVFPLSISVSTKVTF